MKSNGRYLGRGVDPMQKFWSRLTPEDQTEFIILRNNFLQNAKFSSKDRRVVAFRNELIIALRYIEKRPENLEMRSIMTGLCFCGPLIAVNNRQFKLFTGRCKSSINGSFQQLGYAAVKTKAKAKSCIIDLLPSLSAEPQLLRQWTVRIATPNAPICFVSCPKNIPIPSIAECDFLEDAKTGSSDTGSNAGSPMTSSPEKPYVEPVAHKPTVHFQFNPPTYQHLTQPQPRQQPNLFQSQISQIEEPFEYESPVHSPDQVQPVSCTYLGPNEGAPFDESAQYSSMCQSYSLDCFDNDDPDEFYDDFFLGPSSPNPMKKSKSEMFNPPVWQDDILADLF